MAFAASALEPVGEADAAGAVAFGDEAGIARVGRGAAAAQQLELGAGLGGVELDQQLSGADLLALGDQDTPDDAAFEMLDGLAVELDADRAGRHGGAFEGRQHRPGGQTGDHGRDHHEARQHQQAHAGAGRLLRAAAAYHDLGHDLRRDLGRLLKCVLRH